MIDCKPASKLNVLLTSALTRLYSSTNDFDSYLVMGGVRSGGNPEFR